MDVQSVIVKLVRDWIGKNTIKIKKIPDGVDGSLVLRLSLYGNLLSRQICFKFQAIVKIIETFERGVKVEFLFS